MAVSPRQMSEYDVSVARDIGEMKADVRTVKHDLANIQQGMIGLNEKLNSLSNQQSRGLGFFAGAACIVTLFGGVLITMAKVIIGGAGFGGSTHP